jgi:hypothetical protein
MTHYSSSSPPRHSLIRAGISSPLVQISATPCLNVAGLNTRIMVLEYLKIRADSSHEGENAAASLVPDTPGVFLALACVACLIIVQ